MRRTGTAFRRFCPAIPETAPVRGIRDEWSVLSCILVLVCILAALPSRAQAAWPWGQRPTSGVPSDVTGGRAAGAGIPHYLPLVTYNYQPPQPAWSTILWEDFENELQPPQPGRPGWSFLGAGGQYFWARRECRGYPDSGFSAWAVGGGTEESQLSCYANYPDNVDSWMIYGPFSLEGAAMAQMRFQLWLIKMVGPGDQFCYAASHDLQGPFYGDCVNWGTSLDWTPLAFDLGNIQISATQYESMLGDPSVWVAFRFLSDESGNAPEGAYVDDVEVRTCATITCPLGVAAGSARGAAPAGSEPVVLTPAR